MASCGPICHPTKTPLSLASLPPITRSTSPRSSCPRSHCEYNCLTVYTRVHLGINISLTLSKTSLAILTSSVSVSSLPQDDDISGRAGFHLRDLRHVLCPCQFCGLPHPRESQQSQAHAVHQRSAASTLLAGQLCLGYGKTSQTPWIH